MRSLRARLVTSAFVGSSLTLAVSGLVIYWVVRDRLRTELDQTLDNLAQSTGAAISAELGWGGLGEEEQEPSFTLDGVCFSPWMEGQDPRLGDHVSEQQLWDRLEFVRHDALSIRTYGVGGGLDQAPRLIRLHGLETVIGAWIGPDEEANQVELETLVALAHEGLVDVAVIGNEVLSRGDLTSAQLIAQIEWAREHLPADVPVATAEPFNIWLENPGLVAAVDQVLANVHPYWSGRPNEFAIKDVACWHTALVQACQGKPVVVSESGWPSEGEPIEAAAPSHEASAQYMRDFVAWARLNGVRFHYFSAFDEPWKVDDEGDAGAHWGYREQSGKLKPGMRDVFDGPLLPSVPPGITLQRITPEGVISGEVVGVGNLNHRIAIYLEIDGAWWTKPTFTDPTLPIDCDGTYEVNVFSAEGDERATRVVLAVVPSDFPTPVLSGEPSIPPALFTRAVALEEHAFD